MSEAPFPEALEAEVFRLVDRNGKTPTLFHAMGDGPTLDLLGEDELPRLTITVSNDLPTVTLLRPDGNPLISMGITRDGVTGLSISRRDGALQLVLSVRPDGGVEIAAFSPDGTPLWSLPNDHPGPA